MSERSGNEPIADGVGLVMTSRREAPPSQTPPSGADDGIVVYWRPGCGFCLALKSRMKRAGVPHRLVNIWDDPDAAARVRALAGGNETVPTVVVGPIGLVNPTLDAVLTAARAHVPDAVPEGWTPKQPGRLARGLNRLLGG